MLVTEQLMKHTGLRRLGKNEFFKVGKRFDIGKVSEKSRNSVFGFVADKFSATFFNTFSFEKD